jgi:hypothetical protein
MAAAAGLRPKVCRVCNTSYLKGEQLLKCSGSCGFSAHYSCVKQLQNIDYEILSKCKNLRFMCDDCADSEQQSVLTLITNKVTEMCASQVANNDMTSAILSKITEQENEIMFLKKEIEAKFVSLQNQMKVTAPTWPQSNKNNNATHGENKEDPEHKKTKFISENTNNSNSLLNKFIKTAQNKKPQQHSADREVVTPTLSNVPTSGDYRQPFVQACDAGGPDPDVQADSNQFIEVKSRRKRRSPSIVGKSTKQDCGLKGIKRKAHLFLGRFDPETSKESVKEYMCQLLSDVDTNDIEVDKLKTLGKTASFKASFPLEKLEQIKDAELWPSGIILNRFHYKRKNFQTPQPEESQT